MAAAAALVAKATGRPAKCRLDRDQDMVLTGKRHEFRIDYDVGFDEAGRIEGIRFEQFARCGWSTDLSHAHRRPGDVPCGQLLSPAQCRDRLAPLPHQHGLEHRLSWLRRPPGHGRDRAGDGTRRASPGRRPTIGAPCEFLRPAGGCTCHDPLSHGGGRLRDWRDRRRVVGERGLCCP